MTVPLRTNEQYQAGLKAVRFSHSHVRILRYALIKKPPWAKYIPFFIDKHAGTVGQVLDVELGHSSKKQLFSVYTCSPGGEPLKLLGAFFEWELDFEAPTKLTEAERKSLGIP